MEYAHLWYAPCLLCKNNLESHCERGDLNPHPPSSGLDPKSSASANSATLASVTTSGPPEIQTLDPLIESHSA